MNGKGLENVIAAETAVSMVDGEDGKLIYRGYLAADIAMESSFEEAAYLLLEGEKPNTQQLLTFTDSLKERRTVPGHIQKMVQQMPADVDMMNVLEAAVSALAEKDTLQESPRSQAARLIALLPVIIASRHRLIQKKEIVQADPALSHAANYLYMLRGRQPAETERRALEAYLILTMEHGMNASTFTSRVIASTESDFFSAAAGAMGALKGPLHGGAPGGVMDMLEAVGCKENAEAWLRKRIEAGEKVMGFGHRVYKTIDPRAEALKKICESTANDNDWLDTAHYVEQKAVQLLKEYKPERKLYTNVEFYAAAVLKAVDFPKELFTPTFALSRSVGWSAHILEQRSDNRIIRPQSVYTGKIN
ncbi:citrate synthase/methylcitrate synthase [Marinococcus halophilus]|uniref:Citrate synthase n=1 Tax=Marinococcus halophilus TaxID=1371 RepID=A0A510Y9I8_MARHA|nr:citrate synthase/methylcitrate synthase [Marinococcus halophilus]OZT79901.1 citrate synthase/methylcitrate synthase [Marinococcus halophilus]GEK60044.1 citrate synthase 1 [Marinococcus halophilus]